MNKDLKAYEFFLFILEAKVKIFSRNLFPRKKNVLAMNIKK